MMYAGVIVDCDVDFSCNDVNIPIKSYHAHDVMDLRENIGLTRSMLAALLGVSVDMICDYETGEVIPSSIACRFMDEMSLDPSRWRKRVTDSMIYA